MKTLNIDTRAKTARSKIGTSTPVVYRAVYSWLEDRGQRETVLDFGCGYGQSRDHFQGLEQRPIWFGLDLYPRSDSHWILDQKEWPKYQGHFKVVMLSNVVNVQETQSQLWETLKQAIGFLANDGVLFWNYPQSPRRMPLTLGNMKAIIQAFIGPNQKAIYCP